VPPQVTLTATYPGKDPEVIKTTVAQPIEQGRLKTSRFHVQRSRAGAEGRLTR
jgi:hydrophobic/amphiphilic exporter-1 (mainly G- bacteria), HAE1 family